MKLNDDFVMTIDDDEDVPVEEVMEEEVSEEEEQVKSKAEKKKNKKNNDKKKEETDFDTEFTFAIDGGGRKNQNTWDFTAAHGMLKKSQVSPSQL